uniref:Uncharacterized protein n=1 Tax=Arundo donax TaxID=35708 RepID=A0A0A9BWW3_ARUDO
MIHPHYVPSVNHHIPSACTTLLILQFEFLHIL